MKADEAVFSLVVARLHIEQDKKNAASAAFNSKFGRDGKTRTRDTWFWRPVLYQLSYIPISCILA